MADVGVDVLDVSPFGGSAVLEPEATRSNVACESFAIQAIQSPFTEAVGEGLPACDLEHPSRTRPAVSLNLREETSNQSSGLAVSSSSWGSTGEATGLASMTFVLSAIHCSSVIGLSEMM